MRDYVEELLGPAEYPKMAAIADPPGLEPVWRDIDAAMHRADRFDRNLARLLDGFEAELRRPPGPAGPPGLAGHRAGRQARSTAERAVQWIRPSEPKGAEHERSKRRRSWPVGASGGCRT